MKANTKVITRLINRVISASLIVAMLLTNTAFAANTGVEIVNKTFDPSTIQKQSGEIVLPNLKNIVDIQVTDGLDNPITNFTYSTSGSRLNLVMDGATVSGSKSNPKKYSKEVDVEQNQTADEGEIFPYNFDYTDADGYAGAITRNGSSYVKDGKYTPATDRWFEVEKYSTTNSFDATIPYSLAGYSGTLYKMGEAKKEKLDDDETKFVKITSPYYYKGTMNGREVASLGEQGLNGSPEWFIEHMPLTEFGDMVQYNVDGFVGQLELKSTKPTGKVYTSGNQSVIGEGYIETNIKAYNEYVNYNEYNRDTKSYCQVIYPHRSDCGCSDPNADKLTVRCWNFLLQSKPELVNSSILYTMNDGKVSTNQLSFSQRFAGTSIIVPTGSEQFAKSVQEKNPQFFSGGTNWQYVTSGSHWYLCSAGGLDHYHDVSIDKGATDNRAYTEHYRRVGSNIVTNQQNIPSTYPLLNNLIATSKKYDNKQTYGNVGYIRWVSNGELMIKFDTPVVYEGNVTKKAGVQYVQKYTGLLEKPAIDTRTWGQLYSGTIYKSGMDDLYQYKVTVKYSTNNLPDISELSASVVGEYLKINATISDTDFGDQVKVYFRISPRGVPGTPYVGSEMADIIVYMNKKVSYNFDIGNIPNGEYDLYVWAIDGSGGKSAEYKAEFNVFDTVALTPIGTAFILGNNLVFNHNGGLNFINAITEIKYNNEILNKANGDWWGDENTLTISNAKISTAGTFILTIKATNYMDINKQVKVSLLPAPVLRVMGTPKKGEDIIVSHNTPKWNDGRSIKVIWDGAVLTAGDYTLDNDKIVISKSKNVKVGTIPLKVEALDYSDAMCNITIISDAVNPPPNPNPGGGTGGTGGGGGTGAGGGGGGGTEVPKPKPEEEPKPEDKEDGNLNGGGGNLEIQSGKPYVAGYEESGKKLFKPEENVKRAEMAAIFNRILPADSGLAKLNLPKDVSGHWAEGDILTNLSRGIMRGYPDDSFKPNANMTRAEFANALVNIIQPPSANETLFADTSGHWAEKEINALAAMGVLKGYGDKFLPDKAITRAEVVSLINRVAKLEPNNMVDVLMYYLQNPFADVTPDYWAYKDIIIATTDWQGKQ